MSGTCADNQEHRLSFWSQRIGEAVLEVIAPTRCAGCERPGNLICDTCLERMTPIDPVHACTRCGAPYGDFLCTECAGEGDTAASGAPQGAFLHEPVGEGGRATPLAQGGTSAQHPRDTGRCFAATVFEGSVPRIIRAYKDAGEQRLAQPIAELMLDAAEHAERAAPKRYGGLLYRSDAVTFVPVTAAALARRGFDHMELVAGAFAQMTRLPLVDALVKHGRSDQRALGRTERQAQAQGVFEVVIPVAGKRLLLLDDVITTGATMRAARAALLSAGAERVDVLAFARVW